LISIIIIIFDSGKKRRRVESEASLERDEAYNAPHQSACLLAWKHIQRIQNQNSIPNHIVEGFYILTDMPYIGRNHRGIIKHLEPAEFSSDTKNAILNLMGAVYDLRDESDPIRKDWIKWHEEHRQCDAHAVRDQVSCVCGIAFIAVTILYYTILHYTLLHYTMHAMLCYTTVC
jgi:hypothetical protein